MFQGKIQRIHFVGIGGSGMSGIAEVLITMGYTVTGSDLNEGPVVEQLRSMGGTIQIGHAANHVSQADVVVKSTAIPDSNVEVRAAEVAKIPVIPRAEMLGELMRMKYGVAVAGSHGKTTTTSMLAQCLHKAGLDPTIVIGGRLDSMGSSARLGSGELMIAEADESDGSFLLLDPTVTVITSIDPEHMDHWGTMDNLVAGFTDFANKVPFFGFSALCLDHPVVQELLPDIRRRFITYGLSAQAEVQAQNIKFDGIESKFDVIWQEKNLGSIALHMPGLHNITNALAAVTVSLELGVEFSELQQALQGFTGVDRRFSIRGMVEVEPGQPPVIIIDDYGHHPAEIQATLAGAAAAWPGQRILTVFQPHRYTRVRDLHTDFCRSFNDATHVVVCPIYRAGEKPISGIDHHNLADGLTGHGHRSVAVAESLSDVVDHLSLVAQAGDVIITLGAGNVNQVCEELLTTLRADLLPAK